VVQRLLSKPVWETDVARYGIDIWMTTTAMAEGFKVCQVFLGAKIHDPKDPGADLAGMVVQVVGSLFSLMEEHEKAWKMVHNSEPAPLYGFPYQVGLEPVKANPQRAHAGFQQGVRDLEPIYAAFLPPEMLQELQRLATLPLAEFRLPDQLWVSVIFQFALAFHRRTLDRKHLLQSLVPVYLGWMASFMVRTQEASDEEAEQEIEKLCLTYEELKEKVVAEWDKKR
ncbi:MAG: glycosyl transferase family 2, partial [Terriglobia bacterium]